MMHTKIDITAK